MDSADRDQLAGQIIADYLRATERGENPDRAALLAANPELAGELQTFFANHDRMQSAASAALELQRGLELEATLAPGSSAALLSSANGGTKGRPARERIGYFGDYELLAEIARGGMGVVYRARQVNLDRTVALKMILAGQLASADDVRRFYQEAEAAANLEHPGIVPVFEVGQHNQQHFFSMGFVEGPNLAQVLTAGPLPPQQAAAIVKSVAEAIAYAHDRGVIHRDLKPANVLLAKVAGDSQRDGQTVHLQAGSTAHGYYQPKITDFGLAKRTESEDGGLTGTGQIIGTPSYMSPEQASGRLADVAPVSDVYSLGAILYAALTGHPPFQSDSPIHIVRQVLEQEPISPRQANPSVPRDLETICLKCLEKDRRKRYASARELAAELQRFLQGEPIRARRISSVERAWRWCRRKPALATVFALLGLIALGLSLGGPWLAYKEREALIAQAHLRYRAEAERKNALEEQKRAEEARNEALKQQDNAERAQARADLERLRAQENLVASQLLLGQVARENADPAESLGWYLQAYLNSPQGSETRRSGLNLLGAWSSTIEQTLVHNSSVHEMAISQDGKLVLVGYLGSASRIWNRETGLPQGETQGHSGDFVSAVISPDGTFALTGDWAGAKVWDTQTGKLRYPKIDHAVREDTVVGPALSPDGKTILTRPTLEEIRLWDAATGKPLCPPRKHGEYVWGLSFSPDSQLALTCSDDTAQLWDAATGEPVGPQVKGFTDIAFHPDGKLVAICTKDSAKVVLRETASDKQVAELTAPAPLQGVEFDRGGKHLLARGGKDAYLWRNALDPEPQLVVYEHDPGLFAATFNHAGTQLLTASSRLVQVWQTNVMGPLWKRSISGDHFFDRKSMLKTARFSPSGDSVLVVTQNGTAEVLGTRFGELLVREKKVEQAEFTADGKTLVVGSDLGWMRFRPARPELPKRLALPGEYKVISRVAYSPGGKLACVVDRKNVLYICRPDTLEPIGAPITQEAPIHGAALSPDGKLLVLEEQLPKPPGSSLFSSHPGRLQFWDVETRKRIGEPIELKNSAYHLRFDPSGRTLYASSVLVDVPSRQIISYSQNNSRSDERTVVSLTSWFRTPIPVLRDAATGELLWKKLPEKDLSHSALTQDGKRLLVIAKNGAAQLLDAETHQPLGPQFHPVGGCLARSADGHYAVYGDLRTLRIWDTILGRPCGEPLMNEQANAHLAFSPDGTQLFTNWHAVARLWDSATGQPLSPVLGQTSTGGESVQFSPDGKQIQLQMYSTGFHRWLAPQPAQDEPERLQLSVEVRTGMTVENSALRKLSQKEWLERKSRLSALGGPCDYITAK